MQDEAPSQASMQDEALSQAAMQDEGSSPVNETPKNNVLGIPPFTVDLSPIKQQPAVNQGPSKTSGVRTLFGTAPKVKTSKVFKPLGNVKSMALRKKKVPTFVVHTRKSERLMTVKT
ncbi:unnamed protein product [Vicia faba]|uniref:Uncharacterized protein n=1 Tax=Vicia faba TaxID=3906 RepID=A0AAV1AKD2_VICFA|nr:unnamed protein product [Vicia faba]